MAAAVFKIFDALGVDLHNVIKVIPKGRNARIRDARGIYKASCGLLGVGTEFVVGWLPAAK